VLLPFYFDHYSLYSVFGHDPANDESRIVLSCGFLFNSNIGKRDHYAQQRGHVPQVSAKNNAYAVFSRLLAIG